MEKLGRKEVGWLVNVDLLLLLRLFTVSFYNWDTCHRCQAHLVRPFRSKEMVRIKSIVVPTRSKPMFAKIEELNVR